MKKGLFIPVLVMLVLVLAFPVPAFAQGRDGDQLIFGGVYTLESDRTLNGDLAVFGGVVELEVDSLVDGDVVLFGGSIDAGGEVAGDVVVIGGSIDLLANAIIRGDLVTVGASVDREPGARIEGQVITEVDSPFQFPFLRVFTRGSVVPRIRFDYNPLIGAVWFLFRTLALSAFAVLLVMFLPRQTERAADAVTAQPLLAGGVGLLTAIVLPPLLLILALVTLLLLSPVSILGILLLFVAGIYGWIAVGLEVGKRLVQLFDWRWPAAVSAGVGTFLLTIVAFGINSVIPCIGWLPIFLIGCLGMGGVILTRFGTQIYPPFDQDTTADLVTALAQPDEVEQAQETPFPLEDEGDENA